MSARDTLSQLQSAQELDQRGSARWSVATRLLFRFCLVYFGLYCLSTQVLQGLIPFSSLEVPDPATRWPVGAIVTWVAVHVFGVKTELVYFSGSGDKTFDWVYAFCLLIFSLLVIALWSLVDRKRQNYIALDKWFRVFLRFCLAGQMFGYGLVKMVPLQMPFPPLTRLIEPFGHFSPMGVLWYSIGAAPAYEIFAGCAELLGGVLLVFPRTVTLGALICLADLTQVFVLNMTYDVPVKLFSFHLVLICLVLLAPDFRRLGRFFFSTRSVEASGRPPLFASAGRNRIALAVQLAFGLLLVCGNAYGSWTAWHEYGGGKTKSPFYGIWEISELTIDGQIKPPLLTDNERWRRAIFEVPSRMAFQRMDDSLARYATGIDVQQGTLTFTKDTDKNWKAEFTFQRPSPTDLLLDGEMDQHQVHMRLELLDAQKFLLLSRGFHWIQEYPFNR